MFVTTDAVVEFYNKMSQNNLILNSKIENIIFENSLNNDDENNEGMKNIEKNISSEFFQEILFKLREKNQKVIDTGLYRIIRHPMYLTTIFLFLSIPLILDSIFTLIIFLIYPIIIIKRIKNEEKVLEKELKGYKEYKKKVKYKLIPHIW